MRGITQWSLAITVIAAISIFVATSSEASAYGWHYGYYSSWDCCSGWCGGWDACYTPVYYYRPAPIRRALRFVFRPFVPRYRPYYACRVCYMPSTVCYCGCCDPCCDPCCDGVVSYSTAESYGGETEGSTQTYKIEAPPEPGTAPSPTPADTAPAPAPAETDTAPAPAPGEDTATLQLEVPASARVFVNDRLTKHRGSLRRYISRDLQPDNWYTYNIRVEYLRDGHPVYENRTVRMTAGEHTALTFGQDGAIEQLVAKPVDTKVTLHVPAEAKVVLAGNPTRQVGPVRTFSTQRLAPGQTWENYTVRVEIERDNRTLVQERTLDLAAGNHRELTFTFADGMKIAKNSR